MVLKMTECNATDACFEFLADLVEFNSVSKLLNAYVNGSARWVPLDVDVHYNGHTHNLLTAGQMSPEAKSPKAVVKDLINSGCDKLIPCDDIYIKVDVFESEFYIGLDGEPNT